MSDPSDCGGFDDKGVSALEYARLNGLARNYLTDQSPFKLIHKLQENIDNSLTDDSHLPQLKSHTGYDTRERLSISQGGARLLAWAMHPEFDESIEGFMSPTIWRLGLKKCRLELPLLSSDHESDMTEFAKRDIFKLQLKDIRLPLEFLDIEKNEALEFPNAIYYLGTKTLEELRGEKLTVSRENLQYIRNCITSNWDETDEERSWQSRGLNRRASRALLEPVTPPLSPMYRPVNVYDPVISDSAFQVPISSDPLSLTSLDLNNLEREIFEQDTPTPFRKTASEQDADFCPLNGENISPSISGIAHTSQFNSSGSSSSTIEDQRGRRDNFKVEEPLTPPMPVPAPKSVHFSDFVEEMLLGSSSSPPSDSFCGLALDPAIEDAAKRAVQQLEQEGLLAADAMGRIEVPIMDFSYTDPPWKRLTDAMASASLVFTRNLTIKEVIGENIPIWPGLNHGHANLKWNPFSSDLARVALDESPFVDDLTWQNLLKTAEDNDIADTSILTWKPPGLKILKEEDDEEIELASFTCTGPQDIRVLAKRRRVDFEGANNASVAPDTLSNAVQLKSNNARPPREKSTPESKEFGLLMGDIFSAENALDSFLELRGMKKPKLTSSPHFPKSNEEHHTRGLTAVPGSRNGTVERRTEIRGPGKAADLLPCPEFMPLGAPITVIVSSILLKNRALVKHIEADLPGIKLIERDFTADNKIAWIPNSVLRSPTSSSLDSEADIIVSPTTGIILTTLQKVKQKSLPRQKSKPPIRDRLERVSCRYEKILVLVSASSVDEGVRDLNENDCNAFGEFVGFTSGLDSTILVSFVGGGDKTLSKWLANSIVQHAGANSNLLEEETHWELFLRRAGMNTFAAQYISAAVRTQTPNHGDQVDQYGMANFVLMGRQQRLDSFGEICGRRLLEKVSGCLDGRWN